MSLLNERILLLTFMNCIYCNISSRSIILVELEPYKYI